MASKNEKPSIVLVDLILADDIAGASILQGNFLDEEVKTKITQTLGAKADVIMSDMAPNTTGERSTDHIRIVTLCEEAFYFAINNLNPDGAFIAKIFRGGTEHNLLKVIKTHFKVVKHFKPNASRQESSEMYLIATGFKHQNNT